MCRTQSAPKVSMPEADGELPCASSQAMALHYAPSVSQPRTGKEDLRKKGVAGLPDLTDRIRQNGMYETYKSWSNGYMQWRQGAATGARGELSGSSAGQSAVHHAAQRPVMPKIDWPEANESLPTANNQAMVLQHQKQMHMQTQAPHQACARVGTASKIDWPEAGEVLPTAHCQAVALQYQKNMQMQGNNYRQLGNVGLPDLTDAIRRNGMFETYKSWSNGYMQWRQGAATGARGELSGSSAGQSAVHHAAQRPVMPKIDWPEASEYLPAANDQAMALHYQKQMRR